MTDAKLVTSPGKGHGLTDRITDVHFAAFSRGEPTNMVPAVVMLKVHGAGGQDTANGRSQHVKYEIAKCEPILDREQAGEITYLIQSLYEERTSTGEQGLLPIAFPGQKDKEKAIALMERIESWAAEQGLTGAELEQRWRDHYGIGTGEDHSYGDRGVPGDYRKSPVAWLSEFAQTVGVFTDSDEDTAPAAVFSHAADGLDVEDDDPLAEDDGDEDGARKEDDE